MRLGGYQQLVRGEPFRAKFRNGFENAGADGAERAGRASRSSCRTCTTCSAAATGVMVQVQSSWFPLIDRNPQTFVDIPKAPPSAYQKATERVYRGGATRVIDHAASAAVTSPRSISPIGVL